MMSLATGKGLEEEPETLTKEGGWPGKGAVGEEGKVQTQEWPVQRPAAMMGCGGMQRNSAQMGWPERGVKVAQDGREG